MAAFLVAERMGFGGLADGYFMDVVVVCGMLMVGSRDGCNYEYECLWKLCWLAEGVVGLDGWIDG